MKYCRCDVSKTDGGSSSTGSSSNTIPSSTETMNGNGNLPVKVWSRLCIKANKVLGSWTNAFVLYRPLIALTVMVTILTTILIHGMKRWYPSSHVYQSTMRWKHYGPWVHAWMGVFYIIVSLLKLRDINGFVDAFAKYDVISRRYRYYGYVYPFLELVLGLMMITTIIQSSLPQSLLLLDSMIPLVSSIILMMITNIGACSILINKPKQKIRCACMGVHYANLPMSTISLFENAVMMMMSIYCLIAR
jgi:hypothetical protein